MGVIWRSGGGGDSDYSGRVHLNLHLIQIPFRIPFKRVKSASLKRC